MNITYPYTPPFPLPFYRTHTAAQWTNENGMNVVEHRKMTYRRFSFLGNVSKKDGRRGSAHNLHSDEEYNEPTSEAHLSRYPRER